ncbi:MAG: hypothetical protein AAB521_00265 [Patescibacteria group bacterium]
MSWCFAIINSRLAEIYFEEKNGKIKFQGHCYVREDEYKSKRERSWLKTDTKKMRLNYGAGNYKRILPAV